MSAIRTKKPTVILAGRVVKSLLPTSLYPNNLVAKGYKFLWAGSRVTCRKIRKNVI